MVKTICAFLLFLFFGGLLVSTGAEDEVVIKGVGFSSEEMDRAYKKIQKKYILHPQLKKIKRIYSKGMKKRGIAWREGTVEDKLGNQLIIRVGDSYFTVMVSNAILFKVGEPVGFMTWGDRQYKYNALKDGKRVRISIPLYTDVTLSREKFIQNLKQGYKFSYLDSFYRKLKKDDGSVTGTQKNLYLKEDKKSLKNLVRTAEITVSGSKDTKKHPPTLFHDGKLGSSIKDCWISDEKKEIVFLWDSPQRAGKLFLRSGYRTSKSYRQIVEGLDTYYELNGEWKKLPGGKIRGNVKNGLELQLHPQAFRKVRMVFTETPSKNAYISEIKILEWEAGKKPGPSISIGAKKFTEAEMRNAYTLIRNKYGIKANGVNPVHLTTLQDEAPKNRKVYVFSGVIENLSGAYEVKVGNRGWIVLRERHTYKVGDQVSFIAQRSNIRKVVQGPPGGGRDTERRYLDLSIHYRKFVQLIQRGYRFPELKDMLQ